MIAALPEISTQPDMTAQWEATLNAISEKQQSYQNFMQPLIQTLHDIISNASQQLPTQLSGLSTVSKNSTFKKRKFTKKKTTT